MLRVTANMSIDERQIGFRFVRASGPGGQKVDKVADAVTHAGTVGDDRPGKVILVPG